MFIFAFLIGIYAYIIFTLGILGLLYKPLIICLTIIFWGCFLFWKCKELLIKIKKLKIGIIILLVFFQAFVNLIGVFGPERGFDALWYHLTLAKLYLIYHSVFYIPGGLLYYSAMPKLAEMLYVAGLSFGNELLPKLIHFFFGILTCIALYKLQRKFFSPFISTLGVIIFYSNLVVGWESTSAYIDLIRTYFEVMALWGFVNWWPLSHKASEGQGKIKWFIASAIMLGLAITTKLLALGSLLIFVLLIIFKSLSFRVTKWYETIKVIVLYCSIAVIVPMPWFIFSYIHTGNPVYPFFTNLYRVVPESVSLINFIREIWVLFTQASDPLSFVYILLLPFVIWIFPKLRSEVKIIGYYSVLAIIIWYFIPRTGGGRFILPYLPAFSIVIAGVINEFWQNKKYPGYLVSLLVVIIIIFSLFSIAYRFLANYKYVPLLLGRETKAEFMEKNLNFAYGDFYDIDGFYKNIIKPSDTVLLYGFHNLYYVDFPFIDSSWIKKGDQFNYIATQNTQLPARFKTWQEIYRNEKTMVKLYKMPQGQCNQKCSF